MKKLNILVVEDNERHIDAARTQLKEHNVQVAFDFGEAMDSIFGVLGANSNKVENRYDVILTDLLYDTGERCGLQEPQNFFNQKLPFGFALALIAGRIDVPYVGVVSDLNHHQHPFAAAFDYLNKWRFGERVNGDSVDKENYDGDRNGHVCIPVK